jgi:hypothetical protein
LTIRHLPFGSTTKLEDLRARLGQYRDLDSEVKEKSKRRKSEVSDLTGTELTETPAKQKKSKKHKKSQE